MGTAGSVKLGAKSVFYLNTAGTYSSPTFSAVTLISDLSVSPEWDEADAATRASRMKLVAKTMMGLEIGGKLRADNTDANFIAILAALLDDSILDIMVLNGDNATTGVRGWRFDAQVFSGNEDQGLGVAVFDEVKFKPTLSANPPHSVVVTAGAPVFTAF